MAEWYLFHGKGECKQELTEEEIAELRKKIKKIKSPPWRQFGKEEDFVTNNEKLSSETQTPENVDEIRFDKLIKLAKKKEREIKKGQNFRLSDSKEAIDVRDAVNAAIYLRRPLLVTGNPGSGKTSLAYAIAYELNLGPVLSWSITARSTLQEGLYRYDAIARLQDANNKESEEQTIGQYIKLGSLGTAFLPSYLPRVLLIDEIDKSDINLPNDLLNLLEEGQFEITELVRRSKDANKENIFGVQTQDENIDVCIKNGRVKCYAFPIIVMTSNGERDFPQAFKRRCLRVKMPDPNPPELEIIVKAHFGEELFNQKTEEINQLINHFVPLPGEAMDKATDQLLNAIYVITHEDSPQDQDKKQAIRDLLMKPLTESD
ncbi:MoxR family ATPase [Nostoc sp. ChiQUE01b]|uniref:AAA family ATPase n=1 Tax=Nostoc sp. ChiQUE01b TaxID=3075376 RepID=UPI002AD31C78|nr:MoxR family ATPase [Nostoc sp. ChiQUE01b]MDZ8264375.1 MoxR family ATPase [Nostoc sp. ChiQUE01b]